MKRFTCVVFVFLLCATYNVSAEETDEYKTEAKQDILCLMMAYPENIIGVEKSPKGDLYIVTASKKKILYDDKKNKSFDTKFSSPDLQDMMEQIYPLQWISKVQDKGFDPGRTRVYSLLSEVYGANKSQSSRNLTNVNLGFGTLQFNKKNNAAASLKKAVEEANAAAKSDPKIWGCMAPSSGTYNYRVISGTGQLSPHAFGIAIDLARDKRDYWKWATEEQGSQRIKEYSQQLVSIFEKNNFVWGGKWSHFDILHFEYRPEIIFKARYFGDRSIKRSAWYEGVPQNENTDKCIKIIEENV